MAKSSKATTAPVEINPVATVPAAVAQKGKPVRYAPRAAVVPTGTIKVLLEGNPKQPGTDAHDRWARFMVSGATPASLAAAYAEAGLPKSWAALDIRWALKRNFITLG